MNIESTQENTNPRDRKLDISSRIWLQTEEGYPITWNDSQVNDTDIEYERVTRKGVVQGDDLRYWSIAAGGDTTRDHLASYAHEAWSGWMRYLFSKCIDHADGLLIPGELVVRWKRQSETRYNQLPESEQSSDLKEADAMLDIVCTTLFSGKISRPQEIS